ncbi:MAG: DEAD/DEAH box helicase [Oligoflexia bacterium]|nr:DEAD/DEAH box helicase [Oligoflexia bacterium]
MAKIGLSALQAALKKAAASTAWTKGTNLSKDGVFYLESESESEILLRYHKQPVSPKITLWPQEEDWHCDCGDRADPCAHAIGGFLAYKEGKTKKAESPTIKVGATSRIEYRFYPQNGYLYFDRLLVTGKKVERLHNQSLVSLVGGLQSGRTKSPPTLASKDDYAIDHILGGSFQNPLDRYTLTRLMAALQSSTKVLFADEPVSISAQTVSSQARVVDDGKGVKLEWHADSSVSQLFKNGAALCGRTLKAVREPALTSKEREAFRSYGPDELQTFASEILPSFEARMVINIETKRLPKVAKYKPKVVLHLQAETDRKLSAYASMLYGSPPVAEVINNQLISHDNTEIPERDLAEEESLRKRLHQELQIQVGRQSTFEDESALLFLSKVQKGQWDHTGNGFASFTIRGELTADFSWENDSVQFGFHLPDGAGSVDSKKVMEAWKENRSFVPLEGGGWAALPHDWMLRYADRIEAMLMAKKSDKDPLPKHFIPDLAQLCEEEGIHVPDRIQNLCKILTDSNGIPRAPLPTDLKAKLRDYQRKGVDWLSFLKKAGLGALLADDMGLGKTLQSIVCIEGKTLIVCPTSVLQSWADQIQEFRPSLKVNLYHGTNRTLEEDKINLTSYGVLRLDSEKLTEIYWDTVILDETQTIKNPESQIAKAAHELQGSFKIALSGTPIENKLDDLWSQFQYINPGLLWSRGEFTKRFGDAIRSGNTRKLDKLRGRIQPFLLRRKKTEVAPELPPRTETVLHCDLSKEEQNLYRSIVAASKKEVLGKLQESGSVFAALEMLLRLRQSCCHPFLVPGSGIDSSFGSAKLNLLLESLEEAVGLGHRALIFSQWTSLLDLVEPRLEAANITFSRLDGSTRNRDQVVSGFQKEDGPNVMLLSLKAGGVGITLTAADHIYILDPWWNPAAEDQAADRAHRIGQENPVFIHRLVARESVEDKILGLQKQKKMLAEGVVGGSERTADLSKDELLHLLETL